MPVTLSNSTAAMGGVNHFSQGLPIETSPGEINIGELAQVASQVALSMGENNRQQAMMFLGACLLQSLSGDIAGDGQDQSQATQGESAPAPTFTASKPAPAPTHDSGPKLTAEESKEGLTNDDLKYINHEGTHYDNLTDHLNARDTKELKDKCGDWDDKKLSPQQRKADYDHAVMVAEHCKHLKKADGSSVSESELNNGKLDGYTSHKDKNGNLDEVRHGTSAAALQDWSKGQKLSDRLTSHDDHVTDDGGNVDNLPWGLKKVGEAITGVFSKIEHALSQVASFVAALHIPLISQIAQLGEVTTEAVADGADIAHTALEGGNTAEAAKNAGVDMAETTFGAAVDIPGAKQAAKGLVDIGKNAAKEGAKQGAEQVASQYSPI